MNPSKRILVRMFSSAKVFLAVGAAVMMYAAAVLAWSLWMETPLYESRESSSITTDAGQSENPFYGWGNEALDTTRLHVAIWSPISLANACGAGASSCFKCHDGRRAQAPTTDKRSGPWHVDHARVNHSCAGCHSGNPRIIKKEIAHVGLIADPRTKFDNCASCHKPEDVAGLLAKYQKVAKK